MSQLQTAERAPGGPFHSGDSSLVYPTALLLSLSGLVLSFIAYYPGAMSGDSFVMWGMGWIWPWHDWHSAYIALLMGVSRRLVGDPSVLLFFQLLLSWGGLYFAACGLRRQSPVWAALLPLLGFTPMFLVVSGYLHKTPLQASVFLFVFGVLYYHHQWKKTLTARWMLLLILLLLLGIPLREYGLLCALPLGALLFHCGCRRPGRGSVAGYLVAAAVLSGASLAVHHIIVYGVLNARKLHKIQTLYRYDLAAVYALSGVDAAPRMIRKRYRSHASMRNLYKQEKGMWRIAYAYEGGFLIGYSVPKDRSDRLLTDREVAYYRAAWLGALRQFPGTWFRHKVHGFATSLGVGVDMYGFRRASTYRSRQNVYGLQKRGGMFYRALNKYMKRVERSLLLTPWLWLVVTACLLVLGSLMYLYEPRFRGALTPIFALLVSAGLFYPQLFLIGLDRDFRFSYWAVVSSALALHLLLATVLGPAPKSKGKSHGGREASGERMSSTLAGEGMTPP